MPTETVRLPTGEQVQINVPDGLDDEQTAQFLQRAIPEIQANMPERTTPQPSPEEMGPDPATARQLGAMSARDLGPTERRVEAFRGGMGSAAFGVDVPLSAAIAWMQQQLQGEDVSFSDSLEFARGRKQAVRGESPVADAAGVTAGTIPAVLTAAPRFVANTGRTVLDNARRFISGGPTPPPPARVMPSGGRAAEVGRAATVGAGSGGTQTLLEEGDAGPGALVGGVAGPVAVQGTRAVAAIPGTTRRVRNFFTGEQQDITPGVNALARRINVDPDVLRSRFETMRQNLGRPPMMAELMDDLDAAQIGEIGRFIPSRVGQPVRQAAERRAVERQAETAAAIRGGRRDVTPESARVARGEMADRQFGAIADTPIEVDDQLRQFLEDPNTQAAISGGATASGRETARELRGRMLRALDGDGTITAQDLEDIRQAASVPEVAQEARALLTQRVPGADEALEAFARRSQRIEGIEAGGPLITRGRSPSPVPGGREQDLEDVVARGRAPEQAGVRRGARTELARGAERSPSAARSTVRSLSEDEGVGNRLDRIFQQPEANRIRNFARAENRAARSLEGVSQMGTEQLSERATGLAATMSQIPTLGGAATAGFISDVREIARLPIVSARRVATALTDPTRTEEAIRILQSRNISNEAIAEILDRLAATAGITATAAEQR